MERISARYDQSGDCIEVSWASKPGTYYRISNDDRIMALVDEEGNLCGFKISGISLMGEGEKDFINVDLYPAKPTPE